jgi:hypothetical protein
VVVADELEEELEELAPPTPVVPESPISAPPEQAAMGAATSTRPRSAAPALRILDPSSLRRTAPQIGQWVDEERAWQLQDGQASKVS